MTRFWLIKNHQFQIRICLGGFDFHFTSWKLKFIYFLIDSHLGLTKLRTPPAHNRKRLAVESRHHSRPDDSHMFVIKLPPNPYYYGDVKPVHTDKNAITDDGNRKVSDPILMAHIAHFNAFDMHIMPFLMVSWWCIDWAHTKIMIIELTEANLYKM